MTTPGPIPLTEDAQSYAGNSHAIGPNIHIAIGNPSFLLRHGGKEWLTEWHYYFGPSVLHKRTHDPLKNQPGERSPFWRVAQWWHDQGCRVVDGVGQWAEPPTVEVRFRREGKSLVQDDSGDVILRHWQGYEKWGEPKL